MTMSKICNLSNVKYLENTYKIYINPMYLPIILTLYSTCHYNIIHENLILAIKQNIFHVKEGNNQYLQSKTENII